MKHGKVIKRMSVEHIRRILIAETYLQSQHQQQFRANTSKNGFHLCSNIKLVTSSFLFVGKEYFNLIVL